MLRLLCLFLLLLPLWATGQDVPRRAGRQYQKALELKHRHKDAKAARRLEALASRHPSWPDPYATLAQWQTIQKNYKAAAATLEKASLRCKNGKKYFGLLLADAYLHTGQYDRALELAADTGTAWENLRRRAQFLKAAGPAPAGVAVVLLDAGRINTGASELFPQLSADGQWLYYTRLAQGIDADLYRATRDTCGGWLAGRRLAYPVSTSAGEKAAMLSADRHYLFFTRCDSRSPNGIEGGGCDLFMAYTLHPDDSLGASWSTPQSFGLTINTPAYEGEPCLSADNRELLFVSDRPGGYGGKDIYASRFEDGRWQLPRNLGPSINTAGDESTPFLHPDGQTLYFSSTGHPGFGGSDIFSSRRRQDTVWAAPVNLGRPYNSLFDDFGATVNLAGDTLYFSSDRDSAAGNYSLYQSWLAPVFQPGKVSMVQGYVYDSIGRNRLNYGQLYFSGAKTGRQYQVQSNRGDGSYTLVLPRGDTWYLQANRLGYTGLADTLSDPGLALWPPLQKNFALLPANYEKPVHDSLLLVVYFKRNTVLLSDSARAQLATLPPAASGKDAVFIVNGFTDNTGTPLLNEQLSFQRAQLVKQSLTEYGLPAEKITSHGWGEASPVADNDTEENRDLNRRVEVWLRW